MNIETEWKGKRVRFDSDESQEFIFKDWSTFGNQPYLILEDPENEGRIIITAFNTIDTMELVEEDDEDDKDDNDDADDDDADEEEPEKEEKGIFAKIFR